MLQVDTPGSSCHRLHVWKDRCTYLAPTGHFDNIFAYCQATGHPDDTGADKRMLIWHSSPYSKRLTLKGEFAALMTTFAESQLVPRLEGLLYE